jgi:hypothetical protein
VVYQAHKENHMSCYNWERGTIKLPSTAYASFRKSFITSVCVQEQKEFDLCAKAIAQYRARKSLLAPGDALQRDVYGVLHSAVLNPTGNLTRGEPAEPVLDLFRISRLVTHDFVDSTGELTGVPRKQAVALDSVRALTKKLAPLSSVSKTRAFHTSELSVTFDDAAKTVTWDVQDNNHAVERARKSFFGQLLFGMLDKVQWTRGSGGKIVGNDEYTRDNRCYGGGANYVTREYGPQMEFSRRGLSSAYTARHL